MRRKVLVGTLAALTVALLAVVVFFDKLVVAALAPGKRFDPSRAPPAPTYADRAAWSALPTREDAADAPVAGLRRADPMRASVDVFYVHPTSYVGSDWNAAVSDATVNRATDDGATRIQASAFNGCCAVYAPRYRQANLTAFLRHTDDGARAIEFAGRDVLAAFRHYMEHWNQGRPFFIVAHSQGSVHAFRVLREAVVGTAARARLVAAYLIGGPLTEATLAQVPDAPACDSPTQTGCVVAFNARSAGYRGGLDFVEAPTANPQSPRVCVNPLTWRHDDAPGARELNTGAVFFEAPGTVPTPRRHFASARCQQGWLVAELAGPVPRDFMSRLLDYAIGRGNYHPIEFGVFYSNLRENAAARVAAYQAAHAAP